METIKDNSSRDDVSVYGDMTTSHEASSSRDEAAEIRKESAKDTARVRTWRFLVALALLATGIAVTGLTYALLLQDEDDSFKAVVSAVLCVPYSQESRETHISNTSYHYIIANSLLNLPEPWEMLL